MALDKQKKIAQLERIKNMDKNFFNSDLAQFFTDCVEDMRKEIIKRRLKTEITVNRGKSGTDSQRDLDQALVKLSDLSQGRAKIEEFTYNDRCAVIDLFVNNETTLLKIYETLFPPSKPLVSG